MATTCAGIKVQILELWWRKEKTHVLLCFILQVSLVLSFPAIHCQDFSGVSLATGDLHLFHLVTMAHIVQILLTSSTGNDLSLSLPVFL